MNNGPILFFSFLPLPLGTELQGAELEIYPPPKKWQKKQHYKPSVILCGFMKKRTITQSNVNKLRKRTCDNALFKMYLRKISGPLGSWHFLLPLWVNNIWDTLHLNINVQNRELARLSGRAEMGFSHVPATTKSLGTCVTPGKAEKNVRLQVRLQFPPQKQRPEMFLIQICANMSVIKI